MRTRRRTAWGVAALIVALALRFLVPILMLAVALVVVRIEVVAWWQARTRPVLVRLNGHSVYVTETETVDLGDRLVQVTVEDRGGVRIGGVHVSSGRSRRIGDLDVEVLG
jgi:hypothetical protein